MAELMRARKKKRVAGGPAKTGRIGVSKKQFRTLDGIAFDSKSEMKRYAELKILERAGVIQDLECQVKYVLQEKFTHPVYSNIREIAYWADFQYKERGKLVVEDCKGMLTDAYAIKRKILLYKYPDIDFREVKAK
jgi:hypothetical protein